MRKFLLFAILTFACAPLGLAQSTDDYNKFEVYGGYSHNRVDTGLDDSDPAALRDIIDERTGFNGFEAAAVGNLSRYVGLKFDVSGHYNTRNFNPTGTAFEVRSSLYNFLGGVQLKDNSKEARVKPFAHALVGFAHGRAEVDPVACIAVVGAPCPNDLNDTETGFGGAFGGGLDIRAGRRFDVRVVQFDYNPTHLGDNTQHNFRIGAGIVLR